VIKRGQVLVFAVAFLTWLLLTWKVEVWSILVGLFTSLVATWFFGELISVDLERVLQPARYFWFLAYLPVFLWEMIKANLDVAYRVLHPKLPINPGIVKIKTRLKSEVSKTFLANSITLTPGTMTVDIKGDEMYIHWIWVREKEVEKATKAIAEKFEKFMMRIFE